MRERRLWSAMAALVCALVVASPAAGTTNAVVYHGSRASHTIALTFDDGYELAPCRAILSILLRERVPATFFPVGRYVAAEPAFWRQVSRYGFPIGDHSQTHPNMTLLSAAQQLAELRTSRTTIERAIGHPMAPIFRPPYGEVNDQLVASAHRAGFQAVVYWDTDSRDAIGGGTDAQHIRAATVGKNGSIVILHCGPDMTPRILPAIIASYRSRGFTFVTVPQMLGLPGPTPVFPRPLPTPLPALTPLATATASPTPTPSRSPTATLTPTPVPGTIPPGRAGVSGASSPDAGDSVYRWAMRAGTVPSTRAGLLLLLGCLLALAGMLALDLYDLARRRRAPPIGIVRTSRRGTANARVSHGPRPDLGGAGSTP